MNVNYNFCCKKLMRYVENEGADFYFSIIRGKFYWGELEYDDLDMDTFYMKYCPFCGKKVNVKCVGLT